MKQQSSKKNIEAGFSMIEILVVMTIVLIILGVVSSVFTSSLRTRDRETQKTDAMTTVQAAINVISREIGNSGFGLSNNGLVLDNSNHEKIHFRANIVNDDMETDDAGEEIIYYYDSKIDSVVRYDRFATPSTSIVINRVANVTFQYFNFDGGSSTPTTSGTPAENTGKVKITLIVQMEDVSGQPANQTVTIETEVALRNSVNILNQY